MQVDGHVLVLGNIEVLVFDKEGGRVEGVVGDQTEAAFENIFLKKIQLAISQNVLSARNISLEI